MAKEKSSYPMLSSNTWHNLRVQFKKKIPTSITKSYLASILNISESSARTNILAPLKILGFIEDNDKANTDLIVKFRDDNKYAELCKEFIKKIYPQELIDAFPDSDSEVSQIQNWFMTTGVGAAAANRCASFYKELLIADPNKELKSTVQKPGTKTKKKDVSIKTIETTKPSSSSAKVSSDDLEKRKESEGLPSITKNIGGSNGVTVNINIQLSVPETTDEQVYNKFFEALKKHLLT